MKNLETVALSTMKHCDYYKQKIAEHTPPRSTSDERMIRLYQRLLIRDRSLLHNLELLKLRESIHVNATQKSPSMHACSYQPSSPLDLDEFRSLLNESSEGILGFTNQCG
jgi:hypothetical protein